MIATFGSPAAWYWGAPPQRPATGLDDLWLTADGLLAAVRAGESVRRWLRRAARELASLDSWHYVTDWTVHRTCLRSRSENPPTAIEQVAYEHPAFGKHDCAANWFAFDSLITAAQPASRFEDFVLSEEQAPWLVEDLCSPCYAGSFSNSQRRQGAADEAVALLRALGTWGQRLALNLWGPVALLADVTARWQAARKRVRSGSAATAGPRGCSALRRLVALLRFSAGFFGAHKVDARNNA